ncbi:MAG: flagellar basal body protein [Allorhizobium sp.]
MSISAIMSISVSGMQAHQTRLAATANNVANAMTPRYDRLDTKFIATETGGVAASVAPLDQPTLDEAEVDLSSEILSLTESKIAFEANAAVWETGADMWDVLMSIKRD